MAVTAVSAGTDASDDAKHRGRNALKVLLGAGTIFAVLTAGYYVFSATWTEPFPRDASTLVVGRDFLNFWMYGRAAWTPDPGRFYDVVHYRDTLSTFLGAHYPGQNWSYPPSIMLIAAWFGRLPYLVALGIFTTLGLAAFTAVARLRLADARLVAAVLVSPAAVFCLISGQSSFLTAALLLTVFAWLDRRPLLAGFLIGLLTLKPQLGILFPVILAASGRWRVFAAASVTAVVLFAVSAACFGLQAWIDFLQNGLPVQNLVLADPDRIATPYYPTVFMNVRGTGASYAVAMMVQTVSSVFAVGTAIYAFRYRGQADPLLLTALFLACAIAAVPYLLSYDLVALTSLAAALQASGRLDRLGQTVAKLAYWLPLIQIVLGTWHMPGPALIPPAFALVLLRGLRQTAGSGLDKPAGFP
jgi:hypothetical protein